MKIIKNIKLKIDEEEVSYGIKDVIIINKKYKVISINFSGVLLKRN